MARSEIIELLKKYVLLLNSEGVSVNKAFLFGSYSTDTATESSDIDVMIVSNKFDENDDLIIGKIWKLTRKINTKIEPFLVGNKKFNEDNSSPLINMIKDKGIEIV
jgi:predicted nucleotidyltransferase